ncbi:MAG: NADPH:quinone oxidoreductase family protein [Burkholderiaceae bacterium]|nr:NADPH:quinone oxidoreductase family protein [Burkholderiaceae bacterium]
MVRALLCRQWCDFRDLSLVEVAEPVLTPGGVHIAVHYAGLGFAHSLVVAGKYQVQPPRPFIPGTEIAGIVLETAEDVEHVKRGDQVLATVDWGGFAERTVAPAETVYRLPSTADPASSIQLATSYSTAYAALTWRARIEEQENLLVHGAGGALGLSAVELGSLLGARVIACASSAEKRKMALAHGADVALPATGFREQVKTLTNGRGADVVFDPVGGDVFDESLRAMAPEGRILPVGFASGRIPRIPANIVLVKNISVLGFYYGSYIKGGPEDQRGRSAPKVQAMMSQLIGWMQEGRLKPTLAGIFDLNQYAEAMDSVLTRRSIGKVVLRIGPV